MGKMDPTAYDRWWRARIGKEEKELDKQQGVSPRSREVVETTKLNTLGTATISASATEAHLCGAAAMVKPAGAPPAPQVLSVPDDARSTVSQARSQARSHARSGAPSTTHSVLARKLEFLEEELSAERVRRMQAEEEMRQLAAIAAGRGIVGK